MQFRKAMDKDVNRIMEIIRQAQEYLKTQGVDQWQNNYPNIETIETDIKNGHGYVLLKDNLVIGTVAVSFDGEKTYDNIYNGAWLSNNEYAVIHRMAIDTNYKGLGLASIMIKNIEEMCLNKGIYSIKIDTHQQNTSMQKLLHKNGLKYCGIIYLEDRNGRVAFEKILNELK